MNAEEAYVFRHALLRDAAYQLQLPGERARLHELSVEIIEGLFGGRAPELPLKSGSHSAFRAHAIDPYAMELARHAGAAIEAGGPARSELRRVQRLYLRRAVERAEAGCQFSEARPVWQELTGLCEGAERCECLRRHAAAAIRMARYSEAEDLLNQGLRWARDAGDVRAEGGALAALSVVYYSTKRGDECEQACRRALELTRAAGDLHTQASVLSGYANHRVAKSDFKQGEELNREALAIFRQLGHHRGQGVVLANIGNLFSFARRFPEAEAHDRMALELSRAHGFRDLEAHTLVNLADVYRQTGRLAEVEPLYREAWAVAREIGVPDLQGYIQSELADHLMEMSCPDRAETAYRAAVAAWSDAELPGRIGSLLCRLAFCLLALGRVGEAEQAWREGARVLGSLGDRRALESQMRKMQDACEKAGVTAFEAPE